MWTLSGFIDEISTDPRRQAKVAAELGLRYAEVRSAWGVNILDLSDAQLADLKQILGGQCLDVSSIGSPIGKIFIDEDFDPHRARMRRAIDVAQLLGAPYIRIFSFFLRPDADPSSHRDEVMRRLRALSDMAERAGVTLLHENEKDIYGDVPQRCLDIVESVGSANLRLAWDPANFVQVGVRPWTDGYRTLRPYLEYMQIKDAHMVDGTVVPAGHGDGQIPATLRSLRDDSFDGFFSLEPHLARAGADGGFSGPELFTQACMAFTGLLDDEGIKFQ